MRNLHILFEIFQVTLLAYACNCQFQIEAFSYLVIMIHYQSILHYTILAEHSSVVPMKVYAFDHHHP